MDPADPARKPVDLGNGRCAASFAWSEPALLAVVWADPRRGVIELTGAPAFDEAERGRPEATRRHRLMLATDAHAFLRLVGPRGEPWQPATTDVADPARPVWTGTLAGSNCTAWASVEEDGDIGLSWRLEGWTEAEAPELRFGGRLATPDLAEITETDPPPRLDAGEPAVEVIDAGATLRLASPGLGCAVRLHLVAAQWERAPGGARTRLAVQPGRQSVEARIRLDVEGAPPARRPAPVPQGADAPVRRALAYVRGCTALAVAPDERVILTDHRLLPLSWTRDAYYQALLLLASGEPSDAAVVADHLRWLWRRCERPDGRWVRSHHASGARKDRAFQADQQLYPLLELADHWRCVGHLPDGVDWTRAVPIAWAATLAEVAPGLGLVRSAENAADDPALAPFIASAQILLWYTGMRLAEVAAATSIGLEPGRFRATAADALAAFDRHFAAGRPWPYAVDGAGGGLDYHDANDLPLVLAPLWGFCAADDPGWLATIAFAWSAANPGTAAGPRGGLGSAHTPGAWTLGDVQDWLVGIVTGHPDRCARALARLRAVAFHDGMLPEAYTTDAERDDRIRHWFAWPGAAIAAFRLLDERGLIEDMLAAR